MWFGSNYLHYLDRLAIRLTRGRTSISSIVAGVPMVMLTTTGAKTGSLRSIPLIGLPDGERIILVASSWGRKKHPGWYHNLVKNPKATISTPGRSRDYIARLANSAEAEIYWQKVIALYPGYGVYRVMAKHRQIGLFILEPLAEQSRPPSTSYHSPA